MSEGATAPVSPGDVLAGKYRIERVLGAGAMGVVVVAMHTQLEQRVAIKFLLQDALYNEEAVQRFAREAKAAARIRSEHVARVLDVSTLEHGEPYIVMEYLEGQDLDAMIRERGPLPVEEAVDYVLQALEALCEAHLAGVVHRDLKPANMFLAARPDGSPIVKILDFGISKISSASQQAMTQTQAILGSPLYMAPEQMRVTKGVDRRADIWSMGVVLYQLLTARLPFVADTMPALISTVMFEPTPRASAAIPGVPAAIDDVIVRCLEKEPAQRFQSVGELAAALAPYAPPHAQTSLDRITRMTRSSSGEPLQGGSSQGRAGTALPGSQSGGAKALASSGPMQEAWQATHGEKKPAGRGRTAAIAAVGGVVVLLAVGAGVMATRHSAGPTPAAGTGSPMPAATSAMPAITAAAATTAPAAVLAPIDSAAPAATEASSPMPSASSAATTRGTTPRTAPVTRPIPAPVAPAAPAGRPSPAPASPNGPTDFGGRH